MPELHGSYGYVNLCLATGHPHLPVQSNRGPDRFVWILEMQGSLLYITNPKKIHYLGQITQHYDRFAFLLIPPKWVIRSNELWRFWSNYIDLPKDETPALQPSPYCYPPGKIHHQRPQEIVTWTIAIGFLAQSLGLLGNRIVSKEYMSYWNKFGKIREFRIRVSLYISL